MLALKLKKEYIDLNCLIHTVSVSINPSVYTSIKNKMGPGMIQSANTYADAFVRCEHSLKKFNAIYIEW